MQIPIMAIDVFMGRFIASAAFSVKAESAGRGRDCGAKASGEPTSASCRQC
jgi:hypothetical protein